MDEKPDIVKVQVDQKIEKNTSTKALQIKIDNNKSVIVYNHISGYILNALMKAVFPNDN
ncbi:hypothetical protein [Companilactobacillus futsaii]|uniref:Uncharacterized protein n=1 Tax=Companilactobacillus futsaii JCM 17355 TaxID=1423818 RepID=A0ABR5P2Q6_9LACO|nr:hypothetical protein [Companilactobacillus futsaii]KRK90378.1 hypothetical protein FC88_GL001893 [Companilactobacillus futsaii JCM 17355]